jgi:hypothetical protein
MAKKRKTVRRSTRARKSTGAASRSARAAVSVATNAKNTTARRVAALAETPSAICDSDASLQALLKVLRDRDEPIKVRLAALQAIQAASFAVVAFQSCRGDYIAALRRVADDPDQELRQRALGILAREKDGFAQKKLIDGLRDPDKALVPPEKALQLLAYDVHAEAYAVAREIVSNPPNDAARREALRVLSADATSAPMFETLLRDKKESSEVRQLSAAALQALTPQTLQSRAREIVLDTSESDDIQATSLTALTQFGDAGAVAKDAALLARVNELSGAGSATVKQTARRLLNKQGR